MPSLFGKEKKKEELINNLPEIYQMLQREYHISPGDFPNVTKMQVNFISYYFYLDTTFANLIYSHVLFIAIKTSLANR